MGIKLDDFVKDTSSVFTKEEAEMVYLAAGYDLGSEYPDYIETLKGVSEND